MGRSSTEALEQLLAILVTAGLVWINLLMFAPIRERYDQQRRSCIEGGRRLTLILQIEHEQSHLQLSSAAVDRSLSQRG